MTAKTFEIVDSLVVAIDGNRQSIEKLRTELRELRAALESHGLKAVRQRESALEDSTGFEE